MERKPGGQVAASEDPSPRTNHQAGTSFKADLLKLCRAKPTLRAACGRPKVPLEEGPRCFLWGSQRNFKREISVVDA